MNKVTKNIIANYIGKLWGFISIFIFVRFYIDLLGIESYAIINFYAVILGLLAFADAGLTATLTRELARDIDTKTKSNLLYTFERVYIGICLFIIFIIFISANIIANNFLASQIYPPRTVAYFLCLMGVGVALQLFSTLYEGGLQGLQQQVLTNKIRVVWSICRSGVVLLPIYFFPKLEIYFWWQILCNIILLYIFRKTLYSFLPNSYPFFSMNLLKSTGNYALGMMGIAFISAINIQIDKLVTSKYLTMELFGYYSIASTLAQLPTMIIMPIIIAIFPLFSMFVSQKDIESIIKNFHKYSFLITLITAPLVFCIGIYSIPLVTLWTGKPEVAHTIDYVVKMLLIGGLFLCMQLTPFYLALANGFTKINLYSGLVGLIIVIPLMIYSIEYYGMIGATIPWVFINVTSFFLIGIYIVNRFLPKQVYNWIVWDSLVPIAITIMIGIVIEIMFKGFNEKYFFIVKSSIIGTLSGLMNVLLYNKMHPDNVVINFTSILNVVRRNIK